MASDIPPCSLENKLVSSTWDSSVFVLNEFINPNIGNIDGSRNGILVEEEKVSRDIDFVRDGGEHCQLSIGDCEGAGGPGTADPVLWDDWEDFRITNFVRQNGDLCSLSNTDFHIEGSRLRGNWKDGDYFMVDSLGRSICPDLTKGQTNDDNAMSRKSPSSVGSNCGWCTTKTCPDQHKSAWEPVPCYEPPTLNELISYIGDYEPICWDATEKTQVEREAIDSDIKQDELLDKIESVDWSYKGAYLTSLKDGGLLGDFQASGEAAFPRQLEESNDRQQESSSEDRDGTVNLRLQALLGYLSTTLEDLLSRQLEETNDRLQHSLAKNRDETGNIRVQAALGDLSMEGCSEGELERGEPHFALFLTLSYLDLQDLISLEQVCKSLNTAVKGDSSLWQNIHVEGPLSERLTDDALLELAARSQGRLRNLSLIDCRKITDDGLKHVLDISPNLTKLCLPGCTRLTGDGIVRNVRAHKEWSITGLKQLRLYGIFGITIEHLEQLNYLLDGGLQRRSRRVKPRFYLNGRDYPFSYDDDDSIIDIEACPLCWRATVLYDCTNESCQNQRDLTVRECRACILCIVRCAMCGKCIDGEYVEINLLETRCVDCERAIQESFPW